MLKVENLHKSYGKEKLIILNKKNDKFIKKTFRYHEDNSWKEEIAEFTDIILNNKKDINGNSHQALEVMMMVQNTVQHTLMNLKMFGRMVII